MPETIGNLALGVVVLAGLGWLLWRGWRRWNPDAPPSEDKRQPPPGSWGRLT
ncbi:MAG TPA: hypothetical protein VII06_02770 [Chloroflexota bacterium]